MMNHTKKVNVPSARQENNHKQHCWKSVLKSAQKERKVDLNLHLSVMHLVNSYLESLGITKALLGSVQIKIEV